MLLIGGGSGEATCGILYLASYLRRNGVEAYVRLTDTDETDEEVESSLAALVAHVRPRLVGISLKWFHHVGRALLIGNTLRRIDPTIEIAFGGNSASFWWEELVRWPCVDHVVLGDGEVPLLALARGDEDPPNVVPHCDGVLPSRPALSYVQGATSTDDVYYSHFDELFLSQADLHSFSGWVAPGKGCGENCLYCSGTRGMQKATFGRATPFLRAEQSVQRDHREIAPRTWQMRYDFAGSTAEFLERAWAGIDLSRHSTTYFLWGVPPPALAQTLSRTFQRVHMVLDIGCFSEVQRQEQMRRGLLKPCPSDRELLEVIDACQRHPNLELEISGIAGLPFANELSLAQERKLVRRVLQLGCAVGYQRLEAQPGALVTEHPERFGMVSEARSFQQFCDYFVRREPGDVSVPMVRYQDAALEAAVQRTSDEVDALVWKHAEAKRAVPINGRTRLVDASASRREFELGQWLGRHRVPARLAKEKVMVVRSLDGTGLACTPSVSAQQFFDPGLQQGDDADGILSVLGAFERPTEVGKALAGLRRTADFDDDSVHDLLHQFTVARFLAPA